MKRLYTLEEVPEIARQVLDLLPAYEDRATVLALEGDLGAGKTTLTQSLAQELGIEDVVASPTFVIAKFYNANHARFKTLIHIDAYRIEDEAELAPLGWNAMLLQPSTLIIVEWPERISEALPEEKVSVCIAHEGDSREIQMP